MKNKKTAKYVTVVAMLLVLSLYFISGTYARYATELTGKGTVDVAQWKVALKKGTTAVSNDFELELTKTADQYVVANKIAPNATVSGQLALDLTGTEVAVKVKVEVDEANLKTEAAKLGITASDITASISLAGASAGSATTTGGTDGVYTITLPSNAAFTSTNGQYTVTVNVTWTNSDAHNTGDTTAGTTSGAKLSVPITVTVEQLTSAS